MLKELKITTTKTGNHMIVIQDLVSPDFSKQLATRYIILKNESIQIPPNQIKG